MSWTELHLRWRILLSGFLIVAGVGCPQPSPPSSSSVFNNTTDPTNHGATYLTSSPCRACHPDIGATQRVHGHSYMLNRVEGEPPTYAPQGTRAGIPDPPPGFTWRDVSYVIGGYIRKADCIDLNGFIITTGTAKTNARWDLAFPANGTVAGFVPGQGTSTTPVPYGYTCFRCHTTGPLPQNPNDPQFQEGRPGFLGTWVEAGVQCEACHGPGSNHVPDPAARDIYVNPVVCHRCHTRPFDSDGGVIMAANGYIQDHEQYPELLASGGHSRFNCTTCHDPHVSADYDSPNAFVKSCLDCHPGQTMALHSGIVFSRGGYSEQLQCASCHMPYASMSASTATPAVVGDTGRMGDVRTHIFRISTLPQTYTSFFTPDGSAVQKDSQGRAAVTVDFVCLRCHNGRGNAFVLTVGAAAAITTTGGGIHAR
jgi:hypothetical protein